MRAFTLTSRYVETRYLKHRLYTMPSYASRSANQSPNSFFSPIAQETLASSRTHRALVQREIEEIANFMYGSMSFCINFFTFFLFLMVSSFILVFLMSVKCLTFSNLSANFRGCDLIQVSLMCFFLNLGLIPVLDQQNSFFFCFFGLQH